MSSPPTLPFWKYPLKPFSWLYDIITSLRNRLFDWGILSQKQYPIPTISVGNLAVGGSGKTPQVEYLIEYLRPHYQLATLSRGYGRLTKGFRWVSIHDTAEESGDEPLQMKNKYPDISVSVCENRCLGVETLMQSKPFDAILLDDAFQHRYLRPTLNILLTDYRLPYAFDYLMPVGRLRENRSGAKRAHIIIITKCPPDLSLLKAQQIQQTLAPRPHQKVFFTTLEYGEPYPFKTIKKTKKESESFAKSKYSSILAITGIASNTALIEHLHCYAMSIKTLSFPDHHKFSTLDVDKINNAYTKLTDKKACIITTEKDAVRLHQLNGLSQEVIDALWIQPIRTKFLFGQARTFHQIIDNTIRHSPQQAERMKS